MSKKLKEIAKFINGELIGDGELTINGINGVNEARDREISFLLDVKHESLINSTKASCVVVPKSVTKSYNKALIKVENPSIAFSKIIEFLLPDKIPHPKGIHPSAI